MKLLKTIFEYVGLLDWKWQDLPFMAINQPMMLDTELPFLGLVKTCKDEDAVKRLKNLVPKDSFCFIVISTHEFQLPVSDSGYRLRKEMLDCPAWLCPGSAL